MVSALLPLAALAGPGIGRAQNDWPILQNTAVVNTGVSFPTSVTNAHDGSGRLFVTEQVGHVRIIQNGAVLSTAFLDISARIVSGQPGEGSEQGLLDVVFPPGYATKKYFYVSYTRLSDGALVISRFKVTTNANVADATSEQVILAIAKPYTNHNAGQLAFGPDGYLYIGVGDGGSEGDPNNQGQTTSTLLGKILRIDVESGATPYAVPSSNPFVGNSAFRHEIWAYGLRNPWRFSFDRTTGDLYIGDVGQDSWEEVDYQPAGSKGGQNYGWRMREGTYPYLPVNGFDTSTLTDPVYEYPHTSSGAAIIGGYVYRGPSSVRMNGVYFFADYNTLTLRALRYNGTAWQGQTLSFLSGLAPSSLGEDEAGNLYFTDYIGGKVYQFTDTLATHLPSLSADGGTFNAPVTVQLTSDTGATIYYTLDGTTPTTASASILSGGAITISANTQVKAFAVKSGLTSSSVATSFSFTFQTGAPQFLPNATRLTQPTLLSMSSATSGAAIYYTLDGTTPTTASPAYTTPVLITPPVTVKAMATGTYPNSSVTSAYYGLCIQENTVVSTVVKGGPGNADGSPGTALIGQLYGLSIDASGNLYAPDLTNSTVRKITPAGQVSTLAGSTQGFTNGQGTNAQFSDLTGMCIDSGGNLLVVDQTAGNVIRKVTPTGLVSTLASGVSGSGALAADASGTVYIAQYYGVKKWAGGTLSTLVPANSAGWDIPGGLAVNASGLLYASMSATNLCTVSPTGTVTPFLGNSAVSHDSDGPLAQALISLAGPLCFDASGNLYVCDYNLIRKITPGGLVTTLAGSTQAGFADGLGSTASFHGLAGICVDAFGTIYVADAGNYAIRKINYEAAASSAQPDGQGNMLITWPSVAGKYYRVQYSSDLATWQNLGNSVAGTGSTLTATDSGALAAVPQRFYRIVLASP